MSRYGKRFDQDALDLILAKGHVKIAYGSAKCECEEVPSQTLKKMKPLDVWESYQKTGSVHKTGSVFGVCGETVRRLLRSNGYKMNSERWTVEEIENLKTTLDKNPTLSYEEISKMTGRSKNSIALVSSRKGLSERRRGLPDSWIGKIRDARQREIRNPEIQKKKKLAAKGMWDRSPHPRGMLGKKHSEETKKLISEKNSGRKVDPGVTLRAMKTRAKKHGSAANTISRMNASWRSGWRSVNGRRVYFRSRWEYNYALYLELLKGNGEIKEWEFEPETFWFEKIKRGTRSYLPDFRVTFNCGSIEYHEVKGWMDDRSKTKLKRMKKYHPHIKIVLIQADWFKANEPILSKVIKAWEHRATGKKASQSKSN